MILYSNNDFILFILDTYLYYIYLLIIQILLWHNTVMFNNILYNILYNTNYQLLKFIYYKTLDGDDVC